MAFQLIHYAAGADPAPGTWGLVRGDSLVPLPGAYPTTADVLAGGALAARALIAGGDGPAALPLRDVRVLPPVTTPCQIVAQGTNYRSHLREVGLDPDHRTFNMLFRKAAASITGPYDAIVRPPHVQLLDYEIELGLVIGAPIAAPVTVEAATLDRWVGGLVVANDVSARDVQLPQTQFYKGKSYRTFCPVGPYLVIPEPGDLARIPELRLTLSVNGQVRQDESCADMVYGPAETLSEISQLEALAPGDLILTGTPGGVALQPPGPLLQRLAGALLPDAMRWQAFVAMQARRREYLQPGDRVRATIRTPDGAIDLGTQDTVVR